MKKKIVKVFWTLVLLAILITLISFGYKFFWYYKLVLALRDVVESGNYTNIVWQAGERYIEEKDEFESHYTKMGEMVKGDKLVDLGFEGYDEDAKIVSKSYFQKGEYITVNSKENTFTIGTSFINREPPFALINYPILDWDRYDTLKEKLGALISYNIPAVWQSKIKFIEEDGKEYLVWEASDFAKYYFNRDTLLAEKEIFTSGDEEKVNHIFEIEVGNVTDEDVTIPDLNNYTQYVWFY